VGEVQGVDLIKDDLSIDTSQRLLGLSYLDQGKDLQEGCPRLLTIKVPIVILASFAPSCAPQLSLFEETLNITSTR